MDKFAAAFNWNAARAFIAVCEQGSLSAAARVLRETQPTLGRQITKLEEDLGTLLFERLGRSLVLTEAGRNARAHFEDMAEAAGNIHLTASRVAESVEGSVTVTATNFLATYVLPRAMKEIRALAPKLQVEIHASNDIRDLKQREADIAVRYARPTQGDVIGKLVKETRAHLFGSRDYLASFGPIEKLEDLRGATFVGAPDMETYLPMLRDMGLPIGPENLMLTSNSGEVICELVNQGFGVSLLLPEMAQAYEKTVPVLPDQTSIPIPIWLICHRELKTSKKIRLVFDAIERALKEVQN